MSCRTGSRTRRASSGSRSASSSIELWRSAKSTVPSFRSPSRAAFESRMRAARCFGVYAWGGPKRVPPPGAAGASAVPQPPQNRSEASFENPHARQRDTNERPHAPQKRRSGRFSALQRGQFTESTYGGARGGSTGERSSAGGHRAAPGRPAPHPLERADREATGPPDRPGELDDPDPEHDQQLADPLHAREEPEAVPVEDRGAEDGLEQVVAERGPTHRGDGARPPSRAAEEHHEDEPSDAHP